MSKTETVRQLTAAATAQRIEGIAEQIESVRQAKAQSVEELAATLEPLAQAMAGLVEETRETLAEITRSTRAEVEALQAATQQARDASWALEQAALTNRPPYALSALIGGSTAVLVSGFWLWLAPPEIKNQLDPKATAEYLQPALIEAVQPSAARPTR